LSLRKLWDTSGMLVVFCLLFVLLWIFVPNFGKWENIKGLLLAVTTVGMIACTMLFCLAAGDFDLSIGSTCALAGVIAAQVVNKTGSVLYAVLTAVVAGSVIGAVNGFVIAKIGINALITTLATMQIVRGAALIASDGSSVGVSSEQFGQLGQAVYLGIPAPIWLMLICFVSFGLLLNKTIFGRNALAIGGNTEAAKLAGIHVGRTKIAIFALQGIIAAFAGVVLASRVTSGQPTTMLGLELQVISACVLGGVSLTGGVGTMTGVVVGVLILGSVENSMRLLNIPDFWQKVASGLILLTAVMLDRLKNKRTL
jgi:L-arabinose transport system permease protein